MPWKRFRTFTGVIVKDYWRYRMALRNADAFWALCNRYERLEAAPSGTGHRCLWQWTSDLHAPKVLGHLGVLLAVKALSTHPIRRGQAPAPQAAGVPCVSVIIGHRGLQRLPHLLATLESFATQENVAIDCVVVEQDVEPHVRSALPSWVRHVFHRLPDAATPYNRSLGFNIGVQHALYDTLILHDNDMLVPTDYALHIWQRLQRGYEVVNPKRFIFYLTPSHTARLMPAGQPVVVDEPPEAIVQNLEGGGSVGITKQAFLVIGGMDESFLGWGGEDVDFWERANTLKVWSWAALPLVHLWHPAQPGKQDPNNPTMQRYQQRHQVPAEVRIAELRQAWMQRTGDSGVAASSLAGAGASMS